LAELAGMRGGAGRRRRAAAQEYVTFARTNS
jgi:hypothetical protein